MQFADEEDTDVGIDPYLSSRTTVQGTFWKKLIARNPYYKGRQVEIWDGFIPTSDISTYVLSDVAKWKGIIDTIEIDQNNRVNIECVDILKKLSDIEVPPSIDVKIMTDITSLATQITVNNATYLVGGSSYLRIGDEIMAFSSVDTTAQIVYKITRGAFGTDPASHKTDDKVQLCQYYAPQNPFDLLSSMLVSAASFEATSVDSTALATCKAWPGTETNVCALISKPEKLDKLYNEILELTECKSWVGEDLRVTFKKNIANQGGREYIELNDTANIIYKSGAVDLNPESRISRCALYWDLAATAKEALSEDPADYGRIDVAVDYDAESSVEYAGIANKTIFCRWLQSSLGTEEQMRIYAKNLVSRKVARLRDPQPFINVAVELKDSTIRTGQYAKINTDEMCDIHGAPILAKAQVVKRELIGDNKIKLKLQKVISRPIAIIGSTTIDNYTSASTAEKEYGFIGSTEGQMSDGSPCYHIY